MIILSEEHLSVFSMASFRKSLLFCSLILSCVSSSSSGVLFGASWWFFSFSVSLAIATLEALSSWSQSSLWSTPDATIGVSLTISFSEAAVSVFVVITLLFISSRFLTWIWLAVSKSLIDAIWFLVFEVARVSSTWIVSRTGWDISYK